MGVSRDRNPGRTVCQKRQRVEFSDAAKVRERVETNAAQLRLRGARRHVLAAVLKLLCGWSKITDDRVGLPQIVELIAAAGGRRYDLKTIGRALAGLAADELIDLPAGAGPRNAVLHRDPRPFRRGRRGARTGPFRARNHRLQLPLRPRFRHLFRAASL